VTAAEPRPGAERPEAGAEGPEAGAVRRFTAHFGVAPDGIWQAPGRVNLIGEHTDYNDGFALPFAIGARLCAAARARQDGTLVLTSGQADGTETSVSVADLAPGSVSGWAAYPAGVAWAMRTAGYPVGGISLAIDADLNPGAGLSSSAALECAVALALADLNGLTLSRPELALLARRAENDFVGAPTGIMDQMAVLACQQGHALLLDCRSQAGTAVPLDPARSGLALMIIDTRARHELTDGGYASRRLACEEAARALGAPALRDIGDVADLGRLADPLLRRRARHVVTENQRVLLTAELLRAGQVAEVGPLLTASHASLRDDFEVSWPEADAAVAAAAGAGALGARMTGGGFGGSVIALISADRAAEVSQSVSERFARDGWVAPAFAAAVPSASAGRVR
jgi:galactokinase